VDSGEARYGRTAAGPAAGASAIASAAAPGTGDAAVLVLLVRRAMAAAASPASSRIKRGERVVRHLEPRQCPPLMRAPRREVNDYINQEDAFYDEVVFRNGAFTGNGPPFTASGTAWWYGQGIYTLSLG
jgi:hypothetical protein